MAQNIYDNDTFFAGYVALERSIGGLDSQIEWPSLQRMIGKVQGLDVLDLGSGLGFFCRWARDQGAHTVSGRDISENMLQRARDSEGPAQTSIEYFRADMETLSLEPAQYDVVYSSLALHYVNALERLVEDIFQTLKPSGRFVFSIEHPIFTAPSNAEWDKSKTNEDVWPLNQYFDEGPRVTNWLTNGVVKQHRTVQTYINILLSAGFELFGFEEWGIPADHPLAKRYFRMHNRPNWLLLAARKPETQQA